MCCDIMLLKSLTRFLKEAISYLVIFSSESANFNLVDVYTWCSVMPMPGTVVLIYAVGTYLTYIGWVFRCFNNVQLGRCPYENTKSGSRIRVHCIIIHKPGGDWRVHTAIIWWLVSLSDSDLGPWQCGMNRAPVST